ncbi:sugar transferase [uncultured Clostridium sp.]|jgi:O-antigen biosynthesis protein WbqP|uniref:sugar transferase n=1 Tax=uncultured Clostridium sp. TaxID=59620 RepID=UPI002610DBB8|nr:sugar transferase [uncultured Clostridium sp.]
MKRIFDFSISLILSMLLIPIIVLVVIAVKVTSKGPIIFKQKRVGRYNEEFEIYKFRTMKTNTPNVATKDLGQNSSDYLTTIGSFLRKASLDEIPQLFNVIKGDMSLVGPRPIIGKEKKLIELRKEKDIHSILPGITGLAQINGRDDLSVEQKVFLDEVYMHDKSKIKDIKILYRTIFKVAKREGIVY